MYDRKYVLELERIIMDELMPMYLTGCRVCGVDPKSNQIVASLLAAKELQNETPYLLKNDNNI